MSPHTETSSRNPAPTVGQKDTGIGLFEAGHGAPRGPVLVAVGFLAAMVAVRTGSGLNVLETGFVAATLVTAAWWVFARRQMPVALNWWSLSVGALAAVEVVVQGPTWQQSGWQILAGLTAVSALWRMRHPGSSGRAARSARWVRGVHRTILVAAVLACGVLALFALVPALPTPTGRFHVGSQVYTWTDRTRPETQTATDGDVREVVAQAWYPTEVTTGKATKYIGAGSDTALTSGLPPGFFRRYDDHTTTHALDGVPVSGARARWPVLLFSPGLGVARQSSTALCTELASHVVVAMSHPYESPLTQLPGGRHPAPRTYLPINPTGLGIPTRQAGTMSSTPPVSSSNPKQGAEDSEQPHREAGVVVSDRHDFRLRFRHIGIPASGILLMSEGRRLIGNGAYGPLSMRQIRTSVPPSPRQMTAFGSRLFAAQQSGGRHLGFRGVPEPGRRADADVTRIDRPCRRGRWTDRPSRRERVVG